jgi:hypothetical protein
MKSFYLVSMHTEGPCPNTPGLVIPSSEIVDDIRMPDTFRNLIRIPGIPFKRYNLSQITHNSQMPLFIFIPIRYNDLSTGFSKFSNGIST